MGLLNSITAFFKPEEKPAMPDIGRNDICWCGSGKKYKKCHLSKDEEKIRAGSRINCRTS